MLSRQLKWRRLVCNLAGAGIKEGCKCTTALPLERAGSRAATWGQEGAELICGPAAGKAASTSQRDHTAQDNSQDSHSDGARTHGSHQPPRPQVSSSYLQQPAPPTVLPPPRHRWLRCQVRRCPSGQQVLLDQTGTRGITPKLGTSHCSEPGLRLQPGLRTPGPGLAAPAWAQALLLPAATARPRRPLQAAAGSCTLAARTYQQPDRAQRTCAGKKPAPLEGVSLMAKTVWTDSAGRQ